jgi:crotonobetainyl-CoA:carnitine CoA-transferase CaiB-like acyl-CoA transferase
MMLGDLGASVIKVERPGRGDDTREWGPPFDARGESAYYLSVNRNKISVAADLRASVDRALVLGLARDADVVVDNFLPGALDRMGIVARDILRASPSLLWCTITGFGADSLRPGYDYVVQGETGWMAITGEADGDPMRAGVALADVITGKDAAIAILAALAARSAGRRHERRLSISLAESARAALINVAQNALVSGQDARRWGNAHPNLVPYQTFAARDRPIIIAVGSDEQWQACVRVLAIEELARDGALATNRGRLGRRAEIVAAIEAKLRERPAADWVAAFDAARVPCGVVKSVLEVIEDTKGASPLTGLPSSVGGSVRYPPPRLDEQGALIRTQGWETFQLLQR